MIGGFTGGITARIVYGVIQYTVNSAPAFRAQQLLVVQNESLPANVR